MTEEKKNNLSRRDALKVLGAAAGAVALANVPEKWSSPELASGVLPAHAQTSECWAVYLEVLSGVFSGQHMDGPNPVLTGDGSAGSTLGWACQPGCLYFLFDLSSGASGSVRITTIAGTYTENYTSGKPYRDIVIDMGTGEISIKDDFSGGTAGSCTYSGGLGNQKSDTQKSTRGSGFWQ